MNNNKKKKKRRNLSDTGTKRETHFITSSVTIFSEEKRRGYDFKCTGTSLVSSITCSIQLVFKGTPVKISLSS